MYAATDHAHGARKHSTCLWTALVVAQLRHEYGHAPLCIKMEYQPVGELMLHHRRRNPIYIRAPGIRHWGETDFRCRCARYTAMEYQLVHDLVLAPTAAKPGSPGIRGCQRHQQHTPQVYAQPQHLRRQLRVVAATTCTTARSAPAVLPQHAHQGDGGHAHVC